MTGQQPATDQQPANVCGWCLGEGVIGGLIDGNETVDETCRACKGSGLA